MKLKQKLDDKGRKKKIKGQKQREDSPYYNPQST